MPNRTGRTLIVGLACAAAVCAEAVSAQAASDITIRLGTSGEPPGPVVAQIAKGECKVQGSGAKRRFVVTARSTDRSFLLVLHVLPFQGYGHRYEVHPGQHHPAAFDLYGPKKTLYSSVAYDPGDIADQLLTGAVGFRRKGAVVRFAGVAAEADDVTRGVWLSGQMRCG